MTGLIATRLFSAMNVTLETAGSNRRKDGSPIRRSTRALPLISTRQRRILFPRVPFLVTRNSIMAEPTYASANYGGTALSLKAALSHLAASSIMAMRLLPDTRLQKKPMSQIFCLHHAARLRTSSLWTSRGPRITRRFLSRT